MSEPHWRRFTNLEALRASPNEHDDARALPGDWDFLQVQRSQIETQFGSLRLADNRAAYFVCDGYCMLCASVLDEASGLCLACHRQITRKVLP